MKLIKLLVLLLLVIATPTAAQPEPPYLYYYSRMLGGIIIERANGTDSRIIGQDVIPAGLTGIAGPGWSPSGKYFAVTGINYDTHSSSITRTYVIDTSGKYYFRGLTGLSAPRVWSPDDQLILTYEDVYSRSLPSFSLLDMEKEQILSQVGIALDLGIAYSSTDFQWQNNEVVFYVRETDDRYFKITMGFDGSLSKEPVTEEIFVQHYTPFELEDSFALSRGEKTSPSGTFEVRKRETTTLTNMRTGEEVTLPRHSQGTVCRDYIWNDTEEYIITLDGTLVAGGGCAGAVLGVTDSQGKLWRELGGCSWDAVCAGWLPSQVDLSSLPTGQAEPIQLDPVTTEPSETVYFNIDDSSLRLRCDIRVSENRYVVDVDTEEVVYTLYDTRACPYRPLRDIPDEWRSITVAYEPQHQLLATSLGYGSDIGIDVWGKQEDKWVLVNHLTSQGLALEFTPDGNYLRARNTNAWKIYSVDDILRTAREIE
jgi:hypothetical protein